MHEAHLQGVMFITHRHLLVLIESQLFYLKIFEGHFDFRKKRFQTCPICPLARHISPFFSEARKPSTWAHADVPVCRAFSSGVTMGRSAPGDGHPHEDGRLPERCDRFVANGGKKRRRAAATGAWQYEPKWDGFRCLALKEGAYVELRGKSGKSLNRFFPEIEMAFKDLQIKKLALDGELVIEIGGALNFDALQMRLHPAASRIAKLSVQTPRMLRCL